MLAVLVALLLAALATASLLSYMRGVEERAKSGEALVSVVVARAEIPAGTTGSAAGSNGLLGLEDVPRRLIADGALFDVTDLQNKVAATTIHKGEQIVTGRFVVPAELSGVLPIPVNHQAMSLEVDVPHGAGGFVRPGSRVSILAKFQIKTAGGESVDMADYLIQNVLVLAVGSSVVSTTSASGTGGTGNESEEGTATQDRMVLTLALLPTDAPRLALAMTDGVLFVTILPPGQKPVTVPARTFLNEFE
jgi:Flp pilus assembly protein CpaB